ncbi:helix-turn-helix domain-containing protein [Acerihabitans sp. KWT182]|uniref:Helix-turn-helix domain-containing protein n=1 Tax=Acerihabitans sp. KWT182 TaxID=3157919 RepID=A0AAU7Q9N0_9GAMM
MNEYRIKALRLGKAWSQEQLAELSSLSVRTIQRIENGEQASLETLAAIASAFDLSVTDLYSSDATDEKRLQAQGIEEKRVKIKRQIDLEARFYRRTGGYIVISVLLVLINWLTNHTISWAAIVIAVFCVLLIHQGLRIFVFNRYIDKWKAKKTSRLLEK